MIEGEAHKGIVAGLPVVVIEEDGIFWVAPANWFVGLILEPYMNSWFHNTDSPVHIYEGSYLDGLFEWIFMVKEDK